MRNALRFAREKGMEKLQVYKEASLCGFRCVFPGDGKDKPGFKRFQDYLAESSQSGPQNGWLVNV